MHEERRWNWIQLSIVEDIAKAHGWNVQVIEGESGCVRFEFHDLDTGDEAIQEGAFDHSSAEGLIDLVRPVPNNHRRMPGFRDAIPQLRVEFLLSGFELLIG